ncbi:MAG: DUF3098 domain-containing protein [Proteiniphilum sp.]|jgi:hypothetical protein|nr:DUF3098 domain-containing protein [Proteiniphilum sp.]NCD14215.1 DUF3098 domain-containing protein [Bacteroidia bacterium]HHT35443.1 DUF3098 domain-containing protein [Bacteroidales bacterium]MDD2726171.1 DUF3098 domain-containing protein [Proteiniphilum sp.]MDD3332380.1 DUF3098 domain-containing protein [Proteiniphilum sp.]
MSQKNFALSKTNLIICGIAVLLIIAGFLLMTGPATTTEGGFEPDIFSPRRIRVAPIVALSGFVLMIVGILYPSKEKRDRDNKQS